MSNQLTQDLAMIARNAIDYIIELERQRDESEKWRDRDEARAAIAERERDEAEAQRDALLEVLKRLARIIDAMGDMPDGFIHPSPWRELRCEEALAAARAAIAAVEEKAK